MTNTTCPSRNATYARAQLALGDALTEAGDKFARTFPAWTDNDRADAAEAFRLLLKDQIGPAIDAFLGAIISEADGYVGALSRVAKKDALHLLTSAADFEDIGFFFSDTAAKIGTEVEPA